MPAASTGFNDSSLDSRFGFGPGTKYRLFPFNTGIHLFNIDGGIRANQGANTTGGTALDPLGFNNGGPVNAHFPDQSITWEGHFSRQRPQPLHRSGEIINFPFGPSHFILVNVLAKLFPTPSNFSCRYRAF